MVEGVEQLCEPEGVFRENGELERATVCSTMSSRRAASNTSAQRS